MSGKFPYGRITLYSGGIIGFGYVLMKVIVPTPEQTYQALAPDLRRKVDAIRAARIARESMTKNQEQAQLDDPDVQKPVWSGPPPK